jgi:pimeloyl-ACP methyl ester carboxylesterase
MASITSPNEPKSDFVTVNGLRLHYLDWGGDGPPIVILHATGFLGHIYRPIAEALRSIGHVYSYDQCGHGDSERPPLDEIGWHRTASDLEHFIIAMGFKDVRGFGHSAGGTAIGTVAARRPDLISRAVLVEPVLIDRASPTQGPGNMVERTLKRRSAFDSIEAMFRNFESTPPCHTWRKDILRDYCEYGTRSDGHGRRVLKCAPDVEAQFYLTAGDFDGLVQLLKCTVPLLVLFGEKSDTQGITFTDRIKAGAPHRLVAVVPDAGHFLPMEKPEEVARRAIAFLGGE